MTNHGFDTMHDPETDTELHGPTRWPRNSLAYSQIVISFHGRELRRALTQRVIDATHSFMQALDRFK